MAILKAGAEKGFNIKQRGFVPFDKLRAGCCLLFVVRLLNRYTLGFSQNKMMILRQTFFIRMSKHFLWEILRFVAEIVNHTITDSPS